MWQMKRSCTELICSFFKKLTRLILGLLSATRRVVELRNRGRRKLERPEINSLSMFKKDLPPIILDCNTVARVAFDRGKWKLLTALWISRFEKITVIGPMISFSVWIFEFSSAFKQQNLTLMDTQGLASLLKFPRNFNKSILNLFTFVKIQFQVKLFLFSPNFFQDRELILEYSGSKFSLFNYAATSIQLYNKETYLGEKCHSWGKCGLRKIAIK